MTEDIAGSTATTSTRTRHLVTAALIAALIAASSLIAIPLPGGVPITLQVFFVVLAAILLSPGWSFASMAVYVALGAVGIPVFAGGGAGMGVLAGPTGGFLVGFALGAASGSMSRVLLTRRGGLKPVVCDSIAAAVVIVVIYTVGTVQLATVTGMSASAAIVAGVVPFIVGDAIKAAVAVGAATAIRRARGE